MVQITLIWNLLSANCCGIDIPRLGFQHFNKYSRKSGQWGSKSSSRVCSWVSAASPLNLRLDSSIVATVLHFCLGREDGRKRGRNQFSRRPKEGNGFGCEMTPANKRVKVACSSAPLYGYQLLAIMNQSFSVQPSDDDCRLKGAGSRRGVRHYLQSQRCLYHCTTPLPRILCADLGSVSQKRPNLIRTSSMTSDANGWGPGKDTIKG